MSMYQYTTAEICLRSNEVYKTMPELEDAIQEEKETIRHLKEMLFGMVCGTPKDIFPMQDDDGWTPLEQAKKKFDEIMDDDFNGLLSHVTHLSDLQYMLDNFDKAEIG